MAFKLTSLNAELRFSRADDREQARGTPKKLIEHIKRLDPDVMVLAEFSGDCVADGVDDALRDMGYDWREVAYHDADKEHQWAELKRREMMPHMRVLSRLAIVDSSEPRFGDLRNMAAITVADPATGNKVEIVGTHLHDRTKELRKAQIESIVPYINRNEMPKVMAGDFNTVHGDDESWPVRLLGSRVIKWIALHAPSAFPLDTLAHTHDDLRGFLLRAIDMTQGDVLLPLEEGTDLRELDLDYRPTTTPKLRGHEWLPSIRLLQIDHIFASEQLSAAPVKISPDLGSDHRAISTIISIR